MPILRARVMVKRNGRPMPGYPVVRRVETAQKVATVDSEFPAAELSDVVESNNVPRLLGFALTVDRAAELAVAASLDFPVQAGGGLMAIGVNRTGAPALQVDVPAGLGVRVRGGAGYSV